jgi:flavodoxin/NAD-dependent dihydropyrimidine dehydrogenase PreA subunit
MKTVLYYFSATGNTLKAAADLAKELGGADIIPVTKALKDPSAESGDIVGIVFPVYMFGTPLIITDFLNKIRVKKDAYLFTMATFGGLQGRAHAICRDILKKRGIALSAGFSVMMPGNYTPLYGAIPEDQQKKMFTDESLKVKEIAQAVRNRVKGRFDCKPFVPNFLLYFLLYRGGSSQIRKADTKFWVTDACIKCGTCAKVCPVSNIVMKDGRPTWLHHSEHCMACLQWCPVSAIQYDKNTVGRKRYRHPDISLADIMAQKV